MLEAERSLIEDSTGPDPDNAGGGNLFLPPRWRFL